jgi:hemolysin activation/secretion protein
LLDAIATLTATTLWGLTFISVPVAAQSPPNPIFPREPTLPTPQPPAPQPNPLDPPPPSPGLPPVRLPNPDETIVVDRFVFEGNTAFSDEALAAVTQPYIGKPITFAELLQAEAAVTQTYVDAGYINSGAVIPAAQTFNRDSAVITVAIVEGGVEEIQVGGTQRLHPSYVRSRLESATVPPLNRDRLLAALQLLQLDPLIQNISAELQPGIRPERSVLVVRVTEADSFSAQAFLDNERSPSVGSFRRGIRIGEANLLGLGDGLSAAYTNTDGSHAFELDYTVPINASNGTIGLAASYTDTDIIEPPFDRIDIEGRSLAIDLTIRQPILRQPQQELAIGLTASHQQSQTFLLGEEFPLALGADDDGKTKITAIRFFQDYIRRNPRAVIAARSQFNLGFNLFDATINSNAPDTRFFSWRGQAQYVRLLAPETLLIFRTDIQLTPDSLTSLEEFGLGGANSVRGYRQDTLLTDNGVLFSAEARIPILRVRDVRGTLQLIPFLDAGVGWLNEPSVPLDKNTLLGIGAGLLWQMGDNFSARIDCGIPLIEVNVGDRTVQEQGLYFSIEYAR